jgi:hypothetical protein
MPSLPNVALCGVAELTIGFAVGLPIARLVLGPSVAPALAPMLGWAVFNVLALPILWLMGFSRFAAALVCGIALLGGLVALVSSRAPKDGTDAAGVPTGALVAASLLAVIPALALLPKAVKGGLLLSEAMFDHSKAAIIDDIARLGLPPGNPFSTLGGPHLVYYYLWHFGAAIPAALFGAGGWAADIALTWFTAFASLALMMGLAVHLGGSRLAAWLVIPISLAGSLTPLLRWLAPGHILDRALSTQPWPQGWLFQASWVPQHLAAAGCVVLAALILSRLSAQSSWRLVPLLGAVAAAGFQSSVWVGGITFAAAAAPIGLALMLQSRCYRDRRDLLLKLALAAMAAAILSAPFLRDDWAAAWSRQAGAPIAFQPFPVLGELVPGYLRSWLDLPAFWLVLIPIEFAAVFFAGSCGIARALATPGASAATDRLGVALSLLAMASFIIPWLFASTIANNDLGWRGVLPGILALTALAAAAVARWLRSARWLAALATVLWALALPGGGAVVVADATGFPAASAPILAKTPELWAAVRRHSAPAERVANNPLFLADSVRWPVNISWALLADRRSCYAGWNFARAFVPLPAAEIDHIDALFVRVFAGEAMPGDVGRLAERFDCKVVVVTPEDGAWRSDPFAASVYYRLVEQKTDRWRIYRLVDRASERNREPSDDVATRTKVAMIRDAARNDPTSEPATFDRPPRRRR